MPSEQPRADRRERRGREAPSAQIGRHPDALKLRRNVALRADAAEETQPAVPLSDPPALALDHRAHAGGELRRRAPRVVLQFVLDHLRGGVHDFGGVFGALRFARASRRSPGAIERRRRPSRVVDRVRAAARGAGRARDSRMLRRRRAVRRSFARRGAARPNRRMHATPPARPRARPAGQTTQPPQRARRQSRRRARCALTAIDRYERGRRERRSRRARARDRRARPLRLRT